MAALINTGVSRTAIEDKLKKFDNIVTVAKDGHGDFVCSDYTSDVQCIQAALDYISGIGGGVLYIQNGHYNCPAQLVYTGNNLVVRGDGDETLLDFTQHDDKDPWSGSTKEICIYVHGSVSTTNSLLTSAVTKGDRVINVADGSKFAAGDWIRIRSEAIFQPRSHLSNYWTQQVGEIQQIRSVNSNEITLCELALGNYALADTATVDIVNMLENITFRDFKVICTPEHENLGIDIRQAHSVTVSNITLIDVKSRAVVLWDVVEGIYCNNRVTRSNLSPLGYGLCVMCACRDIIGYANIFHDCRHGITCSGDTHYGVQYNQVYTNNTQFDNIIHAGMFGMHPSADGVVIGNNICIGTPLGYINCKNVTVTGNIASNTEPGYSAFLVREAGENVVISSNIFDSPAAAITVKTEYSNVVISDNILESIGNTGFAYGITVREHISKISIMNNKIKSVLSPIRFLYSGGVDDDPTDSLDIRIGNNEFSWSGDGIGIDMQALHKYDKVDIFDNVLTSAIPHAGIRVDNTSTDVNSVVTISNNKLHGTSTGIIVKHSGKISIDNNKVYNATTGIRVDEGCVDYTVVDNNLNGCTDAIIDYSHDAGRIVDRNVGYNPRGNFTAPTLPASTVAYTNSYGYPCRVTVSGGTVTNITLDSIATGLTSGSFVIPIGGTIAITYSSAPTWKWWGL